MTNFFFFLILFANFWIWRVLSVNPFVGFIMILSSIAFYLCLMKKDKRFLLVFWSLLILSVGLQVNNTQKTSLTKLANDDVRVRDMRLLEYSPQTLRLGYWLEARKESIAFFRVLKNFSELIDSNLYFFANHPRERIGVSEFEMFPYIFLPFFLIGILVLLSKKEKVLYFVPFLLSIVLFSFIGSKSNIGPVALFPLFVLAIFLGIERAYKKISKNRVVQVFSLSSCVKY